MTAAVVVASEDLGRLRPETYDRVRRLYWVCAFAGETASPWDWVFSLTEPIPVPNDRMRWRRPTLGETVARSEYLVDVRDAVRRRGLDDTRADVEARHHLTGGCKYRLPETDRPTDPPEVGHSTLFLTPIHAGSCRASLGVGSQGQPVCRRCGAGGLR